MVSLFAADCAYARKIELWGVAGPGYLRLRATALLGE
jgi:hypothetical protein